MTRPSSHYSTEPVDLQPQYVLPATTWKDAGESTSQDDTPPTRTISVYAGEDELARPVAVPDPVDVQRPDIPGESMTLDDPRIKPEYSDRWRSQWYTCLAGAPPLRIASSDLNRRRIQIMTDASNGSVTYIANTGTLAYQNPTAGSGMIPLVAGSFPLEFLHVGPIFAWVVGGVSANIYVMEEYAYS